MPSPSKSTKKTSARATSKAAAGSSATSTRKQLMANEVLEHATRLFAERGFTGTSLQEIATSMGLKRPALYYYFKSKEDLLESLIDQAVTHPVDELRSIATRTDLDAAERLHAITHHIVTATLNHTDRFLLLVKSESELSPAARKKFDESRHEAADTVTGVIEEGIEAGLFRDVQPGIAAFTVYGISNWTAWWYNADRHGTIESVADQLADTALAGLQRSEHRSATALTTASALAALREDLDQLETSLKPTRPFKKT